MVLDAHLVLQAEVSADGGGLRDVRVVYGVGEVEPGERRAPVVAGEHAGGEQRPEDGVGVVVPHENGDLEPHVHAHPVEQVPQEDRARVDVEHLVHSVVRIIVERLVHPLERVAVRLADTAEVAGDGPRSAEVDVGAVDALGVQRLDAGRAQYLDRGADCGEVAAVGLLLFHLAHADEAARENLPLFHRLPDFGEQPREVLERADLERRGLGKVVVPHGALGVDAGAVVGEGDELPLVAERGQPFEVLHEGGVHPLQLLDERLRLSRLAGPFVDVAYRAVLGDDPPEVGQDGVFGVRQILVDLLENVRVDAELLKCHRCFLLIIVLGYKKPGASEMLISKTPGGSVRSVGALRSGRVAAHHHGEKVTEARSMRRPIQ